MNNLVVVGINHRTAPVEIREKLSFGMHELPQANSVLLKNSVFIEGLILSTCNRVEIYAVANGSNENYVKKIQSFLGGFHNLGLDDFQNRFYVHKGDLAIKHLFRVASGLDSMVIGEAEILGQVKRAYKCAHVNKATGKILNRLFQKAFNTAKKIRTDTRITSGSVSVSAVAVRLSKKILGDLKNKKALIIGAGEVGEQLALYLKKNGIKNILVTNRTYEKASSLADRFNAKAVKFEVFRDTLTEVDIVIASTGAPHAIITKKDIENLMPRRKQNPIFIIDLAVPRDVEAEVNKIDNAYLYDIDDLQKIVDKNITLRKKELDICNKIVDAATMRFKDWFIKESKEDGKE